MLDASQEKEGLNIVGLLNYHFQAGLKGPHCIGIVPYLD
jgi:hypothetical protein